MSMADPSESALAFRRMTSSDRHDAFALFAHLVLDDPHYRDSSEAFGAALGDPTAIQSALAEGLAFYIDRPDYGFVWMAFEDDRAIACATVGYAISLSIGKLVAKVDYVIVAPDERRRGVGTHLIEALTPEVRGAECARIDVAAHMQNAAARHFYRSLGFVPSNEERLSLVV